MTHALDAAYRLGAMFSRDLRDAVARGDVTVSIRLWSRAQVKAGGRYPAVGTGTHLSLTQDNCADDEQAEQFSQNWRRMLGELKSLVEGVGAAGA